MLQLVQLVDKDIKTTIIDSFKSKRNGSLQWLYRGDNWKRN